MGFFDQKAVWLDEVISSQIFLCSADRDIMSVAGTYQTNPQWGEDSPKFCERCKGYVPNYIQGHTLEDCVVELIQKVTTMEERLDDARV